MRSMRMLASQLHDSFMLPASWSLLHLPTLPLHTRLSLSWSASYPGTTEPTSKQYQTYLKHWETNCQSNGLGNLEATVANGIDFRATLFSAGLGCSAINIACLPLSSVMVLPNNIIFGSHPLEARFHKGVFELKPSLSLYNRIWMN